MRICAISLCKFSRAYYAVIFITVSVICNLYVPYDYGKLNAQMLVNEQKHLEAENKDIIVIIGASYAEEWKPEEVAGMLVINKGTNGEQSSEMLGRFESDVVTFKPEAIIIWGFINDIFQAEKRHIIMTLNKTKDNIIMMIKKARQNDIIPILATEVTVRGPDTWTEKAESIIGWAFGKKSYQDYINGHVLETNKWIRAFAGEQKLLVLDIQRLLSKKNGFRKREYATADGSHISQKGYKKINLYAEKILSDYFNNR